MEYLLHIAIIFALNAVFAVSLNYIAGFTGIISFGHSAFIGVGAYTVAILTKFYGVPFFAAFPAAFLLAGAIGYLVAFPITKLSGDSLMLISLGFMLIMYNIFLNWTEVTHGALGIKAIPTPEIWGWTLGTKFEFLLFAVLLLIFTLYIFSRITRSPYGRVLTGIRENEVLLQGVGYATAKYKRSVFALGGAFAAGAGGIYASYLSFIEPGLFASLGSVTVLTMVILGGLANNWGAILGAALLTITPEALRFLGLPDSILAEMQQILYGLMLFFLMLLRPRGLLGRYQL